MTAAQVQLRQPAQLRREGDEAAGGRLVVPDADDL
jgi:hypothetical protein